MESDSQNLRSAGQSVSNGRHVMIIWRVVLAGLVLSAVIIAHPSIANAQAALPLPPIKDIPRGQYRSWSLFLICNPTWLKNSSSPKIADLYDAFLGFGRATGRYHAAIWFWKTPTPKFPILAEYVDDSRSTDYCTKFGLSPKESPHIVLTTEYPDPSEPLDKPPVVIALNDLPAASIDTLLTVLYITS